MIRICLYALICTFFLSLPASANDFFESDNYVKGKKAYDKGDYVVAIEYWQVPADNGEGPAQYFIGSMYHAGQGVEKNYKLAKEWYTKAAIQDLPNAHLSIGGMYADGHGVDKDNVNARMWFSLANLYGSQRAPEYLKRIDTRMTPQEIAKSEKMAVDWINKNRVKK